ncbi:hypothetical protein [Streptomyces sp. S.PB5]|uniref:hypothetical protein n=1 Tax=Streptomyces sp. S.PB5 TaxID=3020844 RepID=UPI0025B2037A|nr:hypothetical protein [Streptomyces sp. S.PB5]MDN3027545.1 hypothetical protein [Streptomyces sp. S.PB5]
MDDVELIVRAGQFLVAGPRIVVADLAVLAVATLFALGDPGADALVSSAESR